MITTDKTGVQLFVQCCLENGLKKVVCSPGSRNAPLVIAFDEHPEIETFVVHDERSAGFFAMGMAIEDQNPVGVVCTSGSAMLNYYPAVAEAYYQCIPLVVMSADRPAEWVNHGDGQTIVQEGVYENHIRANFTVDEFVDSGEKENVRDQINEIFNEGLNGWIGPVHFNFPFHEPLYGSVEVEMEVPALIERVRMDEKPDLDRLKETWKKAEKKMILCGQLPENKLLEAQLNTLSNDSSVAILVENTSNITGFRFNHCIDRTLNLINTEEIKDFQPDLLITLGGAVVSKRIKKFLRESAIGEHWKIGYEFPEMDTYRALSSSFAMEPEDFIQLLLADDFVKNRSNYGSRWKQLDYLVKDHLEEYLNEIPFTDLGAFHLILEYLPENSYLHMANSSVVRYCQLFDPIPSVKYFGNRGTSGIDGSVSTACGVSVAAKDKLNVMITGDVSFFYDSNSLWNQYLGSNLKIILVNNHGGGIFRYIEGPSKTPQLEKYFEARHDTSAEHICKAFNVDYFKTSGKEELERELQTFFHIHDNQRPMLLEIFTPPELNDKELREFFKATANWR